MEVGAVKQAFNNEAIHLKKKLNQAKIQIIHKLTRKAKTLTQKKKYPEAIQNKFKRKAETAVREVLEIKKVTPKDLAKFAVSHKGKLADYLNKPVIDKDRACARLLLHHVLEDKYNFLRETFTNIAIDDLLLSREERRKIKREKIEEKQNKRKNTLHKTSESGDWSIEDIDIELPKSSKILNEVDPDNQSEEEDSRMISSENGSDSEGETNNDIDDRTSKNRTKIDKNGIDINNKYQDSLIKNKQVKDSDEEVSDTSGEEQDLNENNSENDEEYSHNEPEHELKKSKKDKAILLSSTKTMEETDDDESNETGKNLSPNESDSKIICSDNEEEPNLKNLKRGDNIIDNKMVFPKNINLTNNSSCSKRQNQTLKNNKKLKEKIIKKKIGKYESIEPQQTNKIADPFFITLSGENYMSLVEPRPPDEVKDEHRQGNRKSRRAAMFGHELKRPYRKESNSFNNYIDNNSDFKKQNKSWNSRNDNNKNNFDSKTDFNNDKNNKRIGSKLFDRSKDSKSVVPEKLHPSWEAKKKQSGILPFKGKKIVFE